jgi:hypothetical protein
MLGIAGHRHAAHRIAVEHGAHTVDASGNGPRPLARHGQNEQEIAIGRRNWLFAGSKAGGERAAASPKDGPTAASMNSCHGPGAPSLSRKPHDDLRPSDHAYTTAGQYLHAPVRPGMEDVRA